LFPLEDFTCQKLSNDLYLTRRLISSLIQTCSLKLVFHIIQDYTHYAINVSGHFLSLPLT